jgi:membrane associated rhomboid family serine protease
MVIPLYDDDPLSREAPPYVTYAIMAINIVVFLFQLGASEDVQVAMLRNFAVFPAAVAGDLDTGGVLPPVSTLLTYMFLHGSWLHIIFNLLFLWVFGDNIEDALGRARFIVFYLLCGIAGGGAYILSDPVATSPLIGASGAVAGVVGAYLLLRPCAKVEVLLFAFIPMKLDAFWVIGFWALTQIWHVVISDQPGVAWWAHVGGLTVGAMLVVVMRQPGIELFECMRPQEPAPPLADIGSDPARR